MRIRMLGPLTWLVVVMATISAAVDPALLLAYHVWPRFYELHTFSDLPYAWVDLTTALWSLLTMIVLCWWIVRAGRNLIALGYDKLSFTPGARAGWFFVPFANLIIPYFAMRELWNASHAKVDLQDTAPLVAIWWGLWLFNLFGVLAASLFAGPLDPPAPVWIRAVLGILFAVVEISMLRAIARAQKAQRGPELAQVFA